MATIANPLSGALPVEDHSNLDPFVSSSVQDTQRHRYSAFDMQQFSLYSSSSPSQTKRALQAHLTETTRRLQETSHLGNALVQQRKELEERLKDVEKQQEENEIGPELRQKLVELEKEFNDVGRETARAFLPKSRVPSGEVPDATAGASVYSSEAQQSPSKPSRIHDITLATEISTSLLSQLRDLQAVLAEKDEALKALNLEKSQLEIESESRLKDDNWSLETQVPDREHRLTQSLNREFEELKQIYAKLNEDHATAIKHHESEISGLRRTRKIDELAAQNQELARAVAYRARADDQSGLEDTSSDNAGDDGDTITPEHSPPPSPSKATPRHGHLESETLKHSLQHAHRMIQNLKNNIHREKTEKIELKRMLQDARDELENKRDGGLNGLGSAGKRRKQNDKDVFKKPARPDRLGAVRSGNQEIVVDEEEWEEQDDLETPSRRPRSMAPGAFPSAMGARAPSPAVSSSVDTSNDAFETATENSDAFETANEREGTTTETDAFQTGAETLDGDSSDDLTETEAGASTGPRNRRPSPLEVAGNRRSFQSTASTSDDETDDMDVRTPVQAQHPRYRLKIRQGGYRRSTRSSTEVLANTPPVAKDSPSSFISSSSTPAQGQSLFAELGNLSGESEDSSVADGTPSRSMILSPESSPEVLRKSTVGKSPLQPVGESKPRMVDSSMMTEPWPPKGAALAGGIGFGVGKHFRSHEHKPEEGSQPVTSGAEQSQLRGPLEDVDASEGASAVPSKPIASHASTGTEPEAPKEHTEPGTPTLEQFPSPPLHMSSITMQQTQPVEPARPAAPEISTITTQQTEPIEPPKATAPPMPTHEISAVVSQETEPASPTASSTLPGVTSMLNETAPRVPVEETPLSFSEIISQDFEPHELERPATAHKRPIVASTATTSAQTEERSERPAAASGSESAKPKMGFFSSVLPWGRGTSEPPTQIAEDETSQSSQAGKKASEESRGVESDPTLAVKPLRTKTTDEGTQTMVSADQIDKLLVTRSQRQPTSVVTTGIEKRSPPSSPKKSQHIAAAADPHKTPRRPGSAGSNRTRGAEPPPLPADHKEVIAAAAQKTPLAPAAPAAPAVSPGSMGPPAIPASAYKNRPRTPTRNSAGNGMPSPVSKGGTTPRPRFSTARSEVSTPLTRRSSVSSFASELDERFNIARNAAGYDGLDPNITDPRMIQAITQTMIGEFLWKYTRKAGRGDMSENRHRRFFWVHPYTRTLYWSEQDPATAGRAQMKAKSVAIEAVQVVTDDNPMPPGLHRKSLIVITPGRSIKFTATTGQRHETWFNALSYLLLRSGTGDEEGNANAEDIHEFNPAYARSASRQTGRSRASLSSYQSHRTTSPQRQVTSLAQRPSAAAIQRASSVGPNQNSMSGRLSSLSGVFRPGSGLRGSFSSRRSRSSMQEASVYDPSVVHDSAEDLRQVIEQQERDADRLENVRACCDGKHDVGSLSRKGRLSTHTSRHSIGHTLGSHSRSDSHAPNSQNPQQPEIEATN
ncbi:hypothetical protein AOQ84DRAFT_400546 [Glonium stellatum]|uniref:PH domain-containing protein n=1 Tax=Glonium stellatum TaxID=574774 RepID=A0A8E2JNF0_9PEZI|nr:hypothetical protein AOQ84DRAFT_400546 [Glonium stellatum]